MSSCQPIKPHSTVFATPPRGVQAIGGAASRVTGHTPLSLTTQATPVPARSPLKPTPNGIVDCFPSPAIPRTPDRAPPYISMDRALVSICKTMMEYDHDDTEQLIDAIVKESIRQSTSWMTGLSNGKQMLWNHLTMDMSWTQQLVSKKKFDCSGSSNGAQNSFCGNIVYIDLSLRQIIVVTILRLLTSTAPFIPKEWKGHPCDESGISVYLKRFVYDYRCDLFEIKAVLDMTITTKRNPIVTLINNLFTDMVTNNRANVIEWMTDINVLNDLIASFLPLCGLAMFNVDTVTVVGNAKFDTESVIDAILGYTMSEDVCTLNKIIDVMDRSLQTDGAKQLTIDQVNMPIASISRRLFTAATVAQMNADFDGDEMFDASGEYAPRRLFGTIRCKRVSKLPCDIFKDIDRLDMRAWTSANDDTSISSRDTIVTCFLACMKMMGVMPSLIDAYVISHMGTLSSVMNANDKKMKQRSALIANLGWSSCAVVTEGMCNREIGDTLKALLFYHLSPVDGINTAVRF